MHFQERNGGCMGARARAPLYPGDRRAASRARTVPFIHSDSIRRILRRFTPFRLGGNARRAATALYLSSLMRVRHAKNCIYVLLIDSPTAPAALYCLRCRLYITYITYQTDMGPLFICIFQLILGLPFPGGGLWHSIIPTRRYMPQHLIVCSCSLEKACAQACVASPCSFPCLLDVLWDSRAFLWAVTFENIDSSLRFIHTFYSWCSITCSRWIISLLPSILLRRTGHCLCL